MATNSNDLAFGAVPGSDLDPSTVQAMLQNLFAQQKGGYPKIDVPEMPPMVRMPSLPAVQALAAPRAPLVGFSAPEGPRPMLAPGQTPGLAGLSGASFGSASGLSGTGSRSTSGSSSEGTDALRNLLGGGARSPAGGSGGGGGAGSLLSSLIRPALNGIRNLLSGSNEPSFNVEWMPDIYRDPTGFGDTTPSELGDFGGPIGISPNDTPYLGPVTDIAPDISAYMGETPLDLGALMGEGSSPGIEPSTWDLGNLFGGDSGGLLGDLGGSSASDLGSILHFAGDPEAGLAGSFGQDAIGSALGDAGGFGLGSVTPYLGAATGLMNLGTGIASGNPAPIVGAAKDLGMTALNLSGLLPSFGAGIPIAAGATILANILTDELTDPKGRVSAVQDANTLASQQLQQGANVLAKAPDLLQASQGDLSQMSDDQVFNLFNEARAGMKSYQLAADPLAHQGQRDSGARYSTFSPNLVGMIDRNGPIAAQAAKAFQDELVHRGWKPEDFKVPEVGMPGGNDSPFAPYYGTLYTPEGNAGEYNNPDLSPNQLAQVMNRQVDLASGGYEGRSQGIPGGTLFLTPEDWAIWGL